MVMTGEMIDAVGKSIGLVNHVCSSEELEKFRWIWQIKLVANPFLLWLLRSGPSKQLNNTLDQGIAIEAQEFANLFDSKDKEEELKHSWKEVSRSGKTVENKSNLHPFVTIAATHRLR